MAHFEVGKRVIAIATHSNKRFKNGDVFELLAIKKCCCNRHPFALHINITYTGTIECYSCGATYPLNEGWFGSNMFAPYDDTLSTLTDADIIYSEETVTVKK